MSAEARSDPAQPTARLPASARRAAVWHEGEWYVRASSMSASVRKLVLKDDDAFLVSDRRGDFPAGMPGELGYYFRGTRFLSVMELRLHGELPVILDASADHERVAIELTNPEFVDLARRRVPANALYLKRELWFDRDVLHECVSLCNFDVAGVELELEHWFDADFADMFELRGTKRAARGRHLPARATAGGIVLSYAGLDECLRTTEIAVLPAASELSERGAVHLLRLAPGDEALVEVRIHPRELPSNAPRAGGEPPSSMRPCANGRSVRNRLALVPRFQSDRDSLDRVLSRAVGDLLAMLSQTPDGLYPYAGIPWYCAPFGRDGSITALQLLPWMPEVARGVLLFQARHQAHDFDDFTDREPGKVFHELRTGEMAALREIPFVPYYGSADATPLFLILLAEYVRVTDDVALLERLWPHALAALEWIERYGDADGDGFVEYAARSPLGLRNQGWKDSFDGISHEDGRLAEPPVAVCEVQAYVVRAYRGCAELAERRGDRERARVWSHRAGELQRRLHESFWLDDLAIYALALDRDKRPCRVATSNAGHVLWAGAAYDAQARAVGAQLMSPELFSGFGVRTLATGARRYSPLAYHNGSVWPHDNALVAEGLRRCGMASAFFDVFGGVLAAVEQAPEQRVPELYCGFRRAGDDKPVPYPVACAPQAWSSGAMLHFVRTMLGLSVDGRSRTVEFDHPALPPWLDRLDVTGLWVPGGSLRFRAERHGNASSIEVVEKPDALDIVVRE